MPTRTRTLVPMVATGLVAPAPSADVRRGPTMRRPVASVLTALLASLVVSCGGAADAPPPTAPPPPPPPPAQVAAVDVSPGTLSLEIGTTGTLSATVRDATGAALTGRTVTWQTAQAAVATVSAGVVTAVAPGTTTVTATSEGRSGSAEITVRPRAVATVTISPDSLQLEVGATRAFTATLRDTRGDTLSGREVTWSTSASAVASVANGTVTAIAPGSAVINASSEGQRDSALLVVIAVPVASITIDPDSVSLFVGATTQLHATLRAANGAALLDRPVTWSSSNATIVAVTAGRITAITPGAVTITATSEGRSATAAITVRRVPVANVQLSSDSLAIGIGESATLIATPVDSAGTPLASRTLVWNSSAPAIVSVVQGVVVGITPGTATITAESEGRQATATVVVLAPPGAYAQGIGAGHGHACVHRNAGDVWCWGMNVFGERGRDDYVDLLSAGAMTGSPLFAQLSVGYFHTCALDATGAALCWGEGADGRLGTGTTGPRFTPGAVATSQRFRLISASPREDHTCAISTTHRLFCWGGNRQGQIGDGSVTVRLAPVEITTLSDVQTVNAGNRFTCATTTAGSSWCWGENTQGQLGIGSTMSRSTPTAVSGGHQFTQFATGNQHVCGLRVDGVVLCWGTNANGELGDGTTAQRSVPAPVAGAMRFLAITAGSQFTCGITTDRAIYCWGRNQAGQIGDGSLTNRLQPTRVQGSHEWWHLSAGRRFVCGVSTDGVYCWGENAGGRLGNGDTVDRRAPTRVVGLP